MKGPSMAEDGLVSLLAYHTNRLLENIFLARGSRCGFQVQVGELELADFVCFEAVAVGDG